MTEKQYMHRWTTNDSRGLPREVNQFIHRWHDAVCTLLQENWNCLLGQPATVSRKQTDVGLARKLTADIPDPGYGAQLRFGPTGSVAIVACPATLVRRLVADLLGAEQAAEEQESDLTPVELSMLELLCGEIARAVAQGWPQLETLECHLDCVVNRPLRTRLFAPEQQLVRTRMQVLHGEDSEPTEIVWLAAVDDLTKVVNCLPPGFDADPKVQTSVSPHQVVEQMRMTLIVELGRAQLTLGQLEHLAPGDVLVLDQRSEAAIRAVIGGRTHCLGLPCRIGMRRGFRVQSTAQS